MCRQRATISAIQPLPVPLARVKFGKGETFYTDRKVLRESEHNDRPPALNKPAGLFFVTDERELHSLRVLSLDESTSPSGTCIAR